MEGKYFFIDINVLITAKNDYYAFDLVPGYWEEFLRKASESAIFIPEIVDEIKKGNAEDELTRWFSEHKHELNIWEARQDGVLSMARILESKELNHRYTEAARYNFAGTADPFLCGYAKHYNYPIVTLEKSSDTVKKIKIPDVCRMFDIEYIPAFTFMRRLGFRI